LFDAVRREKGAVDVLWTSAGKGEERKLGEITGAAFRCHFRAERARHAVHGAEGIAMFNDGWSIFMTGSIASVKAFLSGVCTPRARLYCMPTPACGLSELKDRRIRVNVLTPGQVATPITGAVVRRGDEGAV